MRHRLFWVVFVVTSVLVPSASALACSYGAPDLWVVAWPTPDSGWNNGEEIVPASTDTQIWFALSHHGYPWQVSLLDSDGQEVATDVDQLSGALSNRITSWVMVQPLEMLQPYTTYTVVVDINSPESSGPAHRTWTFTTGDGPLQDLAPKVENLRYYIVEDRGSDDCGGYGVWDRWYVPIVDEPLNPQPYLYEVELHFEGEPGTLLHQQISYDWGTGPRPHATPSVTSFEVQEYPCMTLHITDVVGRSVTSETVCEARGCVNGWPSIDWDQFNASERAGQLELWEQWSDQWEQMSYVCGEALDGSSNTPGDGTDVDSTDADGADLPQETTDEGDIGEPEDDSLKATDESWGCNVVRRPREGAWLWGVALIGLFGLRRKYCSFSLR